MFQKKLTRLENQLIIPVDQAENPKKAVGINYIRGILVTFNYETKNFTRHFNKDKIR